MDIAAYEALIQRLRQGLVSGSDLDEMLQLMRRAFGLCGMVISDRFNYAGWNVQGGDLGAWPELYPEVEPEDPCGPYLLSSAAGSWFVLKHVDAAYRNNSTTSLFRKEGFGDVAIARLPTVGGVEFTTALYRDGRRSRFGERERLFLSLLHPFLSSALSGRVAAHAINQPVTEIRETALRRLAGHAVLSLPSLHVEWTERAKQLIHRQLGPMSARGWQRVERALFRAALGRVPTPIGSANQSLFGNVSVEFANAPLRPNERGRFLALFIEDDSIPIARGDDTNAVTPAEELLSPRQRQIARLAVRGFTLPEIAHELGIGEETVRYHLALAMQRLGIRRRTELHRLVRTR